MPFHGTALVLGTGAQTREEQWAWHPLLVQKEESAKRGINTFSKKQRPPCPVIRQMVAGKMSPSLLPVFPRQACLMPHQGICSPKGDQADP